MKCVLSLVAAALALNLATADQLTIQVDDEVKIFGDSNVLHDTFSMPGPQWSKVFQVDLGTPNVLTIKVQNIGGPYNIAGDIDGTDLSTMSWKCNSIGADEDPEQAYPGVTGVGFDDASWDDIVKLDGNRFWAGPKSMMDAVCRVVLSDQLTIQVDDEVKIFGDSNVLHDTFAMESSQWTKTFKVNLDSPNVLTIKVNNIGGPGNIECDIDGTDCSTMSWKCNSIAFDQDPEQAYPGVTGVGFNDASWNNIVKLDGNRFWAGPKSMMDAVCRVVLYNDLTIKVDDEVKVFGDSAVLFDTFAMEGSQWKESNQVKVPAASDVLIIKVGNTGGAYNIECDLDGIDCSTMSWKCNSIGADEDPEQAYPGVSGVGFDDASWDDIVALDGNKFWAGPKSMMDAVCRVVL